MKRKNEHFVSNVFITDSKDSIMCSKDDFISEIRQNLTVSIEELRYIRNNIEETPVYPF